MSLSHRRFSLPPSSFSKVNKHILRWGLKKMEMTKRHEIKNLKKKTLTQEFVC